jgi:membrane-bound lytic murein transglycosylase D
VKKYLLITFMALIISGNTMASEPLDKFTDKSVIITSYEMPVQIFEPVILAAPEGLNHYGPAPSMNFSGMYRLEHTSTGILFTSAAMDPYALRLFMHDEVKMPDLETLYEAYGYNKAVKRRIDYYSGNNKKSFSKYLSRAGRYIDLMVAILSEKGLPIELAYLPLIESGFDTHAYSPKRAAGPWQFIPATARTFGLKIDWWIDERRDPVKSTRAAAEYLLNLHEKFDNWNLALAAYNTGEGRVSNAIKKVKKSSFWRIRKTRYIARETKNYVPSFIAAASIAIAPESFGFHEIERQEPLRYDTVEIETPMDLAVAAQLTGVKTSVIKELNPELRRWCTPPNVASYTLKIPEGTKDMFLAGLSNTEDSELFYVELYKVKSGDTVWEIARRLGTQIQAITAVNSLGKKALIVAGKTILVPLDRDRGTNGSSRGLKPILKSRKL